MKQKNKARRCPYCAHVANAILYRSTDDITGKRLSHNIGHVCTNCGSWEVDKALIKVENIQQQ